MKQVKYTGIMPALVTPFEEDNKTVRLSAVRDLMELHLQQGAAGFYVLGGTGEGLVMGREAREQMCEAAVQTVAGRVPVIVHVASMHFAEAVELARHAERAGADAG